MMVNVLLILYIYIKYDTIDITGMIDIYNCIVGIWYHAMIL